MAGTPVDAVERAGLRLPTLAVIDRVETQTATSTAESYLFVFHVDTQTATVFCTQPGFDDARPVAALPALVADGMDSPSITPGPRWCSGTSPTNPEWTRSVLIDAGHPATVHLLLQRT